jgi:hypothetical protein
LEELFLLSRPAAEPRWLLLVLRDDVNTTWKNDVNTTWTNDVNTTWTNDVNTTRANYVNTTWANDVNTTWTNDVNTTWANASVSLRENKNKKWKKLKMSDSEVRSYKSSCLKYAFGMKWGTSVIFWQRDFEIYTDTN